MARIEATVTMKNIYEYSAPSYAGYGMEDRYIYTMEAEDGTVYVWRTTKFLVMQVPYTGAKGMHNFEDSKGNPIEHSRINKGDILRIKATVKGESEYKGQPQTEINRVTVLERTFKAKTWEEVQEERRAEREVKKQEQIDSLSGEDFI